MSRIHDALQKAEQEKQGGERPSPPTSFDFSPSSLPTPNPKPHATAEAISSFPADEQLFDLNAQAVNEEFTIASLKQCRQVEWKPDRSHLIFSNQDSLRAPGVEEFRTLRSRLFHLRDKRPLKTIMVSSALPGEGKTFVSGNLTQVLVRHRTRRVLLIDADLRKPAMHRLLGTDEQPGLTNYLSGGCSEIQAMQRGSQENLFFMPAGTMMANPAELVTNGRLKLLLERVGDVFDWIVIDSPPVIPVADATQIAKVADGVILVVQSGTTPYEYAQRARKEFSAATLLGVVLNRVPPDSMTSYHYQGYGYGYGQAYGPESAGSEG